MTMTSGEAAVRVEVDRVTCEGHALCLVYAPEVFDMDDEERAVIRQSPVPEALRAGVEDAAGQCPVQAIRLHEVDAP
jgi:ferredoxin